MPFETGREKTGGRRRGVANKKTQNFEDLLKSVGVNPVEIVAKTMEQMDARDQAHVALRLIEFIFPKRRAVDAAITEVPDGSLSAKERQDFELIVEQAKALHQADRESIEAELRPQIEAEIRKEMAEGK